MVDPPPALVGLAFQTCCPAARSPVVVDWVPPTERTFGDDDGHSCCGSRQEHPFSEINGLLDDGGFANAHAGRDDLSNAGGVGAGEGCGEWEGERRVGVELIHINPGEARGHEWAMMPSFPAY